MNGIIQYNINNKILYYVFRAGILWKARAEQG